MAGAKIHCVDTFEYSIDGVGTVDNYLEKFNRTIEDNGVKEKIVTNKGYSKDVAAKYEDNYFDAIFIDGCHNYNDVTTDIKSWSPKLKSGGILFGHDYAGACQDGFPGVASSVNYLVRDRIDKYDNFGNFNGFWGAIKR